MKIALVGLGYWGPKLLRNLVWLRGADSVVVVDRDLSRVEAMCRDHPTVNFAISLENALEDDEVGAVVIATPVESHAKLALTAIDAGRHVLVEKPLAVSVGDARELVERARSAGVVLMTGHTFLFSERVRFLADYLASGQLGDVIYLTSSRLNLGLHRNDANVIWDLAPHDFSILFYLLGEIPSEVQTTARSMIRSNFPEVAFMNLTFASGIVASVNVSWRAPRKVRNTVIVGESQMIVYDDTQADEPVKIFDKGIIVPESADFAANQLTYRYGDTVAPHMDTTEPLATQLKHFVDCIELGIPCESDGEFGLQVVDALEAAQLSWQRGGIPIATATRTTRANGNARDPIAVVPDAAAVHGV